MIKERDPKILADDGYADHAVRPFLNKKVSVLFRFIYDMSSPFLLSISFRDIEDQGRKQQQSRTHFRRLLDMHFVRIFDSLLLQRNIAPGA